MTVQENKTINLIKDGIFPIKYDINGIELKDFDTGFNMAGTLQGEGKLLGVPSLFLRTSGCNLACAWLGLDGKGSICDTPYTSFNPEINKMKINDIIKIIENNIGDNIRHLVITGGEPLIQPYIIELITEIKMMFNLHITIETNGTIHKNLRSIVDLMSISPKLSNSVPTKEHLDGTGISYQVNREKTHKKLRKNLPILQEYLNEKNSAYFDFQLKFVVSRPEDIIEIKEEYLDSLIGWNENDIVLMPEGYTKESLQQSTLLAVRAAIENGWRFTPRLHVDLFNNKKFV